MTRKRKKEVQKEDNEPIILDEVLEVGSTSATSQSLESNFSQRIASYVDEYTNLTSFSLLFSHVCFHATGANGSIAENAFIESFAIKASESPRYLFPGTMRSYFSIGSQKDYFQTVADIILLLDGCIILQGIESFVSAGGYSEDKKLRALLSNLLTTNIRPNTKSYIGATTALKNALKEFYLFPEITKLLGEFVEPSSTVNVGRHQLTLKAFPLPNFIELMDKFGGDITKINKVSVIYFPTDPLFKTNQSSSNSVFVKFITSAAKYLNSLALHRPIEDWHTALSIIAPDSKLRDKMDEMVTHPISISGIGLTTKINKEIELNSSYSSIDIFIHSSRNNKEEDTENFNRNSLGECLPNRVSVINGSNHLSHVTDGTILVDDIISSNTVVTQRTVFGSDYLARGTAAPEIGDVLNLVLACDIEPRSERKLGLSGVGSWKQVISPGLITSCNCAYGINSILGVDSDSISVGDNVIYAICDDQVDLGRDAQKVSKCQKADGSAIKRTDLQIHTKRSADLVAYLKSLSCNTKLYSDPSICRYNTDWTGIMDTVKNVLDSMYISKSLELQHSRKGRSEVRTSFEVISALEHYYKNES